MRNVAQGAPVLTYSLRVNGACDLKTRTRDPWGTSEWRRIVGICAAFAAGRPTHSQTRGDSLESGSIGFVQLKVWVSIHHISCFKPRSATVTLRQCRATPPGACLKRKTGLTTQSDLTVASPSTCTRAMRTRAIHMAQRQKGEFHDWTDDPVHQKNVNGVDVEKLVCLRTPVKPILCLARCTCFCPAQVFAPEDNHGVFCRRRLLDIPANSCTTQLKARVKAPNSSETERCPR